MLRKRFLVSVLMILFLAIPLMGASAKGVFTQIVISSENLESPIIVNDGEILDAFAMHNLAAMLEPLPEAPTVGVGYTITRGYYMDDASFYAFDEAIYYPDMDGGLGYLYYEGMINGWSEFDQQWYQITAQGELALQRTLMAYRIEHAPQWSQGILTIFLEERISRLTIAATDWWLP